MTSSGDVFYDYSSFDDERLRGIIKGWDGLGGYHGLLIRKCALLAMGHSVLDVGCGLCHLFEGLQKINHLKKIDEYVGVEKNFFILGLAHERYPDFKIVHGDIYNLSVLPMFDTVYAVGLYREEPRLEKGIVELLSHANRCVILTYFADVMGRVPKSLKIKDTSVEFVDHDIDGRLEIVRLWKH